MGADMGALADGKIKFLQIKDQMLLPMHWRH